MVVGTLSLVQKCQSSGCSGCSVQWNSGIWWWGHCSLVQKCQTSGRSMQWTQWNSDIWWWGHCLWCKKVKPVDGVDAVTQRTMSHHHISLFHSIHCILHTASTGLTFFVSKTMSPPPYTIILLSPLHTASTVSTSLNFLYQRQCPHHHITLFHCVLHPLHTASTVYCIHCIHCVLYPLCDCIH